MSLSTKCRPLFKSPKANLRSSNFPLERARQEEREPSRRSLELQQNRDMYICLLLTFQHNRNLMRMKIILTVIWPQSTWLVLRLIVTMGSLLYCSMNTKTQAKLRLEVPSKLLPTYMMCLKRQGARVFAWHLVCGLRCLGSCMVHTSFRADVKSSRYYRQGPGIASGPTILKRKLQRIVPRCFLFP